MSAGVCAVCERHVNIAAFSLCHACYKDALRAGGLDAYREQAGRDKLDQRCINCDAPKGQVRFTTVNECDRCYKYRRSHDGAPRPLWFASTPSRDLGGPMKPMRQVRAENPALDQFLTLIHDKRK